MANLKVWSFLKDSLSFSLIKRLLRDTPYQLELIEAPRDPFPSINQILEVILESRCDIILLPLTLPNYLSLNIAELIHLHQSPIRLVLISGTNAPAFILHQLFDCFQGTLINPSVLKPQLLQMIETDPPVRLQTQEEIDAAIASVLATASCFNIGSIRHTKGPSRLDTYKQGYIPNLFNSEEIAPTDQFLQGPLSVFISYAHEDEPYKDELIKHLALLEHQNLIHPWHDRKIMAGDHWQEKIDKNLAEADVIFLLISSSFVASRYCFENEMKLALHREKDGWATVVPIIIRPVDWQDSPFSYLQALPKDGKPVSLWMNQDEAWATIAAHLREIVGARKKERAERG